MTTSQDNPNDMFWLARYAHNTLGPLFAQAKTIEPSLTYSIQITFADTESVHNGNHLGVYAHWDRDGMFQYSPWLRDKAAVDFFAAKVRDDVANLRPLETGIPA